MEKAGVLSGEAEFPQQPVLSCTVAAPDSTDRQPPMRLSLL